MNFTRTDLNNYVFCWNISKYKQKSILNNNFVMKPDVSLQFVLYFAHKAH